MNFTNVNEQDKDTFNQLLNGDIKTIQRFEDSQFEKKYDVYLVETHSSVKGVLKKISLNEYVINNILKDNLSDPILPVIYELIQSKDGYWLFSEYIEGDDLRVLKPEHVEKLSASLAKICSYFYLNKKLLTSLTPTVDEQLQSMYTLLKKLAKNSDISLAYSLYIKRFIDMPLTLAHDDLLPMNAISNENDLKIIDWEYGRINTYVADITRFCCFYYADKKIFEKGLGFFGQEQLINQLKEQFYLNLDSELKKIISWEQFKLDYELESFNQNILNLSYLENINPETLTSDWDNFFYNRSQSIARNIIDK